MNENHDSQNEQPILKELVQDIVREQRLKRRWGIFFKVLFVLLIIAFLVILKGLGSAGEKVIPNKPHVALIEVKGKIASSSHASAENLIKSLDKAFDESNVKGVILKINSPGGSPVQSGMVYEEIMRLKKLHPDKPVYAVAEEVCASGSYYIAAAADKIFVDKASLVGSIGVLINGFGVTGLMDKVGVERRLLTAGKYKGFLDPFSPQSADQVAYAKDMLKKIHAQFISAVKQGRGKRLKDDGRIFTGLVFVGEDAVALGLADGIGSVQRVAEDEIKCKDIVDYSEKEKFSDRLLKKFGVSVGYGIAQAGIDLDSFRIE